MMDIFVIDKENFESYIDESGLTVLDDDVWEMIAEEIQGRVDNFMEELIPLIVEDYLNGEYDA
jgi:hypothetical protein